jgi:ABC-type sugar transport system substrate-binding protein
LITSIPGVGSLDQRAKGFKEEIAGYEGIKTALAASKGEKVPETVDTGVNLITKENMNSERSKELLTPDVTKY